MTLLGTLFVVFTVSLVFSIISTADNQPFAYFNSLTRVWEFALGGLLALGIDHINLPKFGRVLLGWFGITALVACGLVLQVGSVFPGYMALWPTVAALLVIVAGASGTRWGVDWILSARPLEYLGNLSYALYLWHWPVLVFYLIYRQRTEVGLLGGAFIIGVSVILSMLTYHLIENPLRRSAVGTRTPWAGYRFGLVLLIPVIAAAGTWQFLAQRQSTAYEVAVGDPNYPGAAARVPGFQYWGDADVEVAPSFITIGDDWAQVVQEHCAPTARNEELEICRNAVGDDFDRHIVVVGDSHAEQWLTALYDIADRENWQISSMLRGACPYSVESETDPNNDGCRQWNADATSEIIEMNPDAVFTIGSRDVRVGPTEATPPGFVEQWRRLDEAGIPLLAMRDNPRYDFKPSECAAENGVDAPQCSTPRAELLTEIPPYELIPDVPANVSFLDFSDYICTEDECPPAIGNVLVYLDHNHIGATYMRTMAPFLETEIYELTGW
ncbi:hypothetical protein BKA25_003417 [Actinoalloteichus hymeniacidonis]|nr:hypothetical protein [Actinoalloteichus hymeniacidonis]